MNQDEIDIAATNLTDAILETMRRHWSLKTNHYNVISTRAAAMALAISIGKSLELPAKEIAEIITKENGTDNIVHSASAIMGSRANCKPDVWKAIVSKILGDLLICNLDGEQPNVADLTVSVTGVIAELFCVMSFAKGLPSKSASKVASNHIPLVVDHIVRTIDQAIKDEASKN